MCEARVFVGEGCDEKEIMRDVVHVEPDGDTWVLVNLLGERKIVRGNVTRVDFLRHTVHLTQSAEKSVVEG